MELYSRLFDCFLLSLTGRIGQLRRISRFPVLSNFQIRLQIMLLSRWFFNIRGILILREFTFSSILQLQMFLGSSNFICIISVEGFQNFLAYPFETRIKFVCSSSCTCSSLKYFVFRSWPQTRRTTVLDQSEVLWFLNLHLVSQVWLPFASHPSLSLHKLCFFLMPEFWK